MCILSDMDSIGKGSNEQTEMEIITEILMILHFACQNVVMRFTALLAQRWNEFFANGNCNNTVDYHCSITLDI